jgi:hypothetical protein
MRELFEESMMKHFSLTIKVCMEPGKAWLQTKLDQLVWKVWKNIMTMDWLGNGSP